MRILEILTEQELQELGGWQRTLAAGSLALGTMAGMQNASAQPVQPQQDVQTAADTSREPDFFDVENDVNAIKRGQAGMVQPSKTPDLPSNYKPPDRPASYGRATIPT
jgi:hypothetical protein